MPSLLYLPAYCILIVLLFMGTVIPTHVHFNILMEMLLLLTMVGRRLVPVHVSL